MYLFAWFKIEMLLYLSKADLLAENYTKMFKDMLEKCYDEYNISEMCGYGMIMLLRYRRFTQTKLIQQRPIVSLYWILAVF